MREFLRKTNPIEKKIELVCENNAFDGPFKGPQMAEN